MDEERAPALTDPIDDIAQAVGSRDLTRLAEVLTGLSTRQVVSALERLGARQRAVVFRLLPKQQALEVFESLEPSLQGEIVTTLQDAEVAALFAELDPDDRVWLLDELPAVVAQRLLRGLPDGERALTAEVLGVPRAPLR